MKLALISDIHDRKEHLRWAMDEIQKHDIGHVLCLGDIVSPFTVEVLIGSSIPMFAIFGNNEGDRATIMQMSLRDGSNLVMSNREYDEFEIDGKKYFLSHYPEIAEDAAWSGKYDAVFHGHTHVMRTETINNIPLICPGEICGYATRNISFAIYDTQTQEVVFVEK